MPRPRHPVTGDVKEARAVLAWAKEWSVPITKLIIGKCTIELSAPESAPAKKRRQR